MDEKTLNEVKQVVESASNGNWLPFGIVCGCLVLCLTLFIYILNLKDKQNTMHHEKTDDMLEKLAENSNKMGTIIAVHETEINNLKKTG